MSRHWDTAVAVAAMLNARAAAAPFALPFVARAVRYPDYRTDELAELRVDVYPIGPVRSVRSDRASSERRYPINVAVQRQCEKDDLTLLASLSRLLEQVQNALEEETAPAFGRPAEWTEVEENPLAAADALYQGVVSTEYRAWREDPE